MLNTYTFYTRCALIAAFLAIGIPSVFASDQTCKGSTCTNSAYGVETTAGSPVTITATNSQNVSVCQQITSKQNLYIPTRLPREVDAIDTWINKNNGGRVNVSPCSINCVGGWSGCSNGSQTYSITTAAQFGGTACAYANGATRSCGTPCVGSWGSCSAACGAGIETFNVTQAPAGGGTQCPSSPVACVGSGSYDACGTCNGTVATKTCNTSTAKDTCGNPCTVNGVWGPWTGWSNCPGGCAPYANSTPTTTRTRLCNSPSPANGGSQCQLTNGTYGLSETQSQN